MKTVEEYADLAEKALDRAQRETRISEAQHWTASAAVYAELTKVAAARA